MKMTVIGIEVSEGVGKKSGKPYAMGSLHTTVPLAAPFGQGNVAKGAMGTTYEAPVEVLRPIAHLSFPLVCEVETRDIMRFGQRRQEVVDVRPVELVKAQPVGAKA